MSNEELKGERRLEAEEMPPATTSALLLTSNEYRVTRRWEVQYKA